ncbi:MAG: GNAT family protein [Actinomycetota bacterium]
MVPLDQTLHDDELTVRPFVVGDRAAMIAGRDDEFRRFLPDASSDPQPMASICVSGTVVGWIDYDHDDDRHWLRADQVNMGYNVFPEHRGHRYASRALRLLTRFLLAHEPPLHPTLLIDPQNAPSMATASLAGFEDTGVVDGERFFVLPDSPPTR